MVRASRQSSAPSVAGLGPPRFGLRGLLWTITTLAMLFALLASIGAISALMVILLALLVAAHVLGNWLGTTLQNNTPRPTVRTPQPRQTRTP